VRIPGIASGGVGSLEHLLEGLTEGRADAVLAASIFHYGEHTVAEAKEYLRRRGVPVRPASAGAGGREDIPDAPGRGSASPRAAGEGR